MGRVKVVCQLVVCVLVSTQSHFELHFLQMMDVFVSVIELQKRSTIVL